MALRRFYIEPDRVQNSLVRVEGDLFHHIRDVVRFGIGDEFELLPGDGRALRVRIQDNPLRSFVCEVLSERQLSVPKPPHLHLVLSLPKMPKLDWIIEKSVELGAMGIHPVVSDQSFLRKLNEISESRKERWKKIVVSATQQSGRGDLMSIAEPVELKSFLNEFNLTSTRQGLFPYEGESALGMSQAVAQILKSDPNEIWLFIGSEGGFSKDEVELFKGKGMPPVSMGEQILRVETACVAALSILKYACHSMDEPNFIARGR